jgi:antitoxin CcdA
MLSIYDTHAPKKPTNVSINSDLLLKAKNLDINLSSTLEQALYELIKNELKKQWANENKEAISAYNEYIAEHGCYSNDLRSF